MDLLILLINLFEENFNFMNKDLINIICNKPNILYYQIYLYLKLQILINNLNLIKLVFVFKVGFMENKQF